MYHILSLKTDSKYESLKNEIKRDLRDIQHESTIYHHQRQCTKWNIPEMFRPQCPKTLLPNRAIATLLHRYNEISTKYDKSFVPDPPPLYHDILTRILTEGDNNPAWYVYRPCNHCLEGAQYRKLHALFQCPKHKTKRYSIYDSIIIEIERIRDTFKIPNIIPPELFNLLIDARDAGITCKGHTQAMLTLLMGGHTNPAAPPHIIQQTNRILRSHLALLINIHQNTTIWPDNITTIIDEDDNEFHIAAEDLEAGRIVVRTIQDNQIIYSNIRYLIDSLSIPDLKRYKIGLGSASTRTVMQKRLANLYAAEVVRSAAKNKIYTDGSVNTKDNPMSIQEQKRTGTGYGGYGGVMTTNDPEEPVTYYLNKVDTNDSQMAELKSMLDSTILAKHHHQQTNDKEYSILCDCRNAVNYVNRIYTIPTKYSNICQEIMENLQELRNDEIYMEVDWMPGHTENQWNDIADTLAKQGALCWTGYSPPRSRSLGGSITTRFFVPRDARNE